MYTRSPQPDTHGAHPAEAPAGVDAPPSLVGASQTFRRVLTEARQVAPLTVGVLLLGETGTGKSTLAEFIHKTSPRAAAPFVELNCANIPGHLIESELFGHERGAFTDAKERKAGLFEAAGGGTLFLDEIEEMSRELQAKLLRAIETKKVTRLGGRAPVSCDVRFLYATNGNLGRLREDLVFRMDEASITIPPLRERREDIPALLDHYFTLARQRMERAEPFRIGPPALSVLCGYEWPGNIRQLGNVVLKVALLCKNSSLVRAEDVGRVLRRRACDNAPGADLIEVEDTVAEAGASLERPPSYETGESVDVYLARVLVCLYDRLKGERGGHTGAAEALRVDRGTLYARIRKARQLIASQARSGGGAV